MSPFTCQIDTPSQLLNSYKYIISPSELPRLLGADPGGLGEDAQAGWGSSHWCSPALQASRNEGVQPLRPSNQQHLPQAFNLHGALAILDGRRHEASKERKVHPSFICLPGASSGSWWWLQDLQENGEVWAQIMVPTNRYVGPSWKSGRTTGQSSPSAWAT